MVKPTCPREAMADGIFARRLTHVQQRGLVSREVPPLPASAVEQMARLPQGGKKQ